MSIHVGADVCVGIGGCGTAEFVCRCLFVCLCVRAGVRLCVIQWFKVALERGADGIEELLCLDKLLPALGQAGETGEMEGSIAFREALQNQMRVYGGGEEQKRRERKSYEELCWKAAESIEMLEEMHKIGDLMQARMNAVESSLQQ